MTQKETVLQYIKDHGEMIPAKDHGFEYRGTFLGSETSRRCRELAKEGKLVKVKRGRFTGYRLPSDQTAPSGVAEKILQGLKEDREEKYNPQMNLL